MNEFLFSIPQSVKCGYGVIENLTTIIENENCKKVFLVSDRGLEKAGIVNKVVAVIEKTGVEIVQYLDVLPNPTVRVVNEAFDLYQNNSCDLIIAVGGGSTMDTAKAVGILARYGGKITDYAFNPVPGKIMTMVAIPTTAGTGSEVTPSSVITDEETKFKFSVFTPNNIPAYALIDPQFIVGLPSKIASSCGVDALIHAMEAYISNYASPFTDAMAEKAMQLIGRSIRDYVKDTSDVKAAEDMIIGSTLAGVSFSWARLGNIHAMSHPVSAHFNVAHGVANAILMPTIFEYNEGTNDEKYRVIYDYVSLTKSDSSFKASDLTKLLRELNKELGIPDSLSAVGAKKEEICEMAIDAMKSGNVLANPRKTTIDDITELYNKAF